MAERRFSWTTLLARLERTLPADVGIARLQPTFDKDGEIALEMALVARNRERRRADDRGAVEGPRLRRRRAADGDRAEGAPAADPFQFHLSSRYAPEEPR